MVARDGLPLVVSGKDPLVLVVAGVSGQGVDEARNVGVGCQRIDTAEAGRLVLAIEVLQVVCGGLPIGDGCGRTAHPVPDVRPGLGKVVSRDAAVGASPSGIDVVPTRRGRVTGPREHELDDVAGIVRAVWKARVHHVEVHQQECPGGHAVEDHAVGLDRVRVQVAAGLDARWAHLERRLVGEVEPDQVARQVMPGARQRALGVLMPAGTRDGPLAHPWRVDLGRQLDVPVLDGPVDVHGAVRVHGVVRAGDGGQCTPDDRAVEDAVHLRNPRQDVVAVPAFLLDRELEERGDFDVGARLDVGRQVEEAVGDELTNLIVAEELQVVHGETARACWKGRSTDASMRALVSA